MAELPLEQIVINYCRTKPMSNLGLIMKEAGVDAATKLVELFIGKTITVPTKKALLRTAMPLMIKYELYDLERNSVEWNEGVKFYSKLFRLPKRAIETMARTGKHTR